jgi:hypothetical protein
MGTLPFDEQQSDLATAHAKAEREFHPLNVGDSYPPGCSLAAFKPLVQAFDGVEAVWRHRYPATLGGSRLLQFAFSRPPLSALCHVTAQLQDPIRPGASICVR